MRLFCFAADTLSLFAILHQSALRQSLVQALMLKVAEAYAGLAGLVKHSCVNAECITPATGTRNKSDRASNYRRTSVIKACASISVPSWQAPVAVVRHIEVLVEQHTQLLYQDACSVVGAGAGRHCLPRHWCSSVVHGGMTGIKL